MQRLQSSLTTSKYPKITVIIPTYNRGAFICDAIDSVLSQTFQDFELIIVDDGSTDNTAVLISAYADSRLRYLTQENKGRSNARNRALAVAQGEYIAFLDSDDMYLPDKLRVQTSFMDSHPDVGMIYTSALCVDEEGRDLNFTYVASVSGYIYRYIAFFQPVTITLPTVMVRRAVFDRVGGFDEQMSRFEDTDMWRRISKLFRICAMPIETCKLRTHADNSLASQNPASILQAIAYYCTKIRREDSDQPLFVRLKGFAALYRYYGRAFQSVPGWEKNGRLLIASAYVCWPPDFFRDLWNASPQQLRFILRLPYLVYRKARRILGQRVHVLL
jgi:glycosyltransferase involved in cell wall biosynthesis